MNQSHNQRWEGVTFYDSIVDSIVSSRFPIPRSFLPVFPVEYVEGAGHGLVSVEVGVEKVKHLQIKVI